MVVHSPPKGRNGYKAWNKKYLIRSLLGLPVPPKRFVHPEFQGLEDPAAAEAAAKSGQPTGVQVVSGDAAKFASHEVFDRDVYANSDVITAERVAVEGDESVFSFGTAEDFWFTLVNEASWASLIGGELMVEALMILMCGFILTFVALVEGKTVTVATLGSKVLLSLTTVRLSTDSIYGWQAGTPSTPVEIFILAIFGWVHWLILSIASALIVARALRPATSGLFSPDMVVNSDSAQVRFMVLRNQHQGKMGFLYNLEFQMQAMTVGGQTIDLPLIRNKYAQWLNSNNIITLRHPVTDPSSPFNPEREGGPVKVSNIFVTLTAMDVDGNSVLESVIYYDPNNLDKDLEEKLRPFPRVLMNHKFVDMYRIAKHPETGDWAKAAPVFICNLDNFIKVAELQPDESGFLVGTKDGLQ